MFWWSAGIIISAVGHRRGSAREEHCDKRTDKRGSVDDKEIVCSVELQNVRDMLVR